MLELGEPTVPPEQARRVVEEVLSRPEYRDVEPGFLEQILERVLTAIGELLQRIGGTGEGTRFGMVLLVLLVLVALVLVWRFARGVRRDPGIDEGLDGQVGRAVADWLGEAERHEQDGRLRDAVRCRYRALVARLAAEGIVEEIPGRTAGEYRLAVAEARPDLAEGFSACTTVFESAWYGEEPVDAELMQRFRANAERVAQAAAKEVVA